MLHPASSRCKISSERFPEGVNGDDMVVASDCVEAKTARLPVAIPETLDR